MVMFIVSILCVVIGLVIHVVIFKPDAIQKTAVYTCMFIILYRTLNTFDL